MIKRNAVVLTIVGGPPGASGAWAVYTHLKTPEGGPYVRRRRLGILTGSPVLSKAPTKRLKMTRIVFVTSAFASLAFNFQPAAADYYAAPWCAVMAMGDGDMQWDCEYRSVEECRPNVLAGNRGWCNPNPYFVAPHPSPEHRRHHKRHIRPQ